MWNEKFTYTLLLVGSIIFPLLFSFEKKICFIQFRKPIFWAILIPGVFFIIWDVLFTKLGFWSFNSAFTFEPRFLELPIEEWLFFVVIPYCSLFVYEVLKFYMPNLDFNKPLKLFLWTVSISLLVIGILEFGAWYTFICLGTTAIVLFAILIEKSMDAKLTHFVIAFLISCLPMFVVNGVLTALPVVEYNQQYFSGLRIGTIPVEDFCYFLLLFSMNVFVYEKAKKLLKQPKLKQQP
jgi:lycopene cyclase domain-containing protein